MVTSNPDNLDRLLRKALKSQYHAALAMLQQAVEHCPDDLWIIGEPPFWQIAYHTAFFTHFYLGKDEDSFQPWEHHRARYQSLDSPPAAMEPYTRPQILGYVQRCIEMVDEAVDALDLTSRHTGFPWYRMSKLEHQLINLRHIQHHTTHLSARLRSTAGSAVDWIGPMRSD
jgi:hypothetical protein